jgi:hypothetical protein
MKRRAFALCAGLLLLGLVPGSAMAVAATPPSHVDQSVTGGEMAWSNAPSELSYAQTFTASETGDLNEVDLYLGGSQSITALIEDVTSGMPNGTSLGSAAASFTNTESCDWVPFDFTTSATPVTLTAGTMYAIVFSTSEDTVCGYGSGNEYTGGEAWVSAGNGWNNMFDATTDLDFMTWMEDSVKPTLSWDKSSVTAGTTTPLTLTATMKFTNGPDDEIDSYSAASLNLPSWFSPTSIGCTDSATPGNFTASNCTLADFTGAGISVSKTDPGDTLTFTVVGTAHPVAANVGTPGVAQGDGCLVYSTDQVVGQVRPNQPAEPYCVDGSASVAVVAAAPAPTASPTRAPTPPPTTTGSGSSSNGSGSMMWFLPVGLIAFLGALLLAFTRTRRRIA